MVQGPEGRSRLGDECDRPQALAAFGVGDDDEDLLLLQPYELMRQARFLGGHLAAPLRARREDPVMPERVSPWSRWQGHQREKPSRKAECRECVSGSGKRICLSLAWSAVSTAPIPFVVSGQRPGGGG